jgi:hypothetical protein
MTDDWSVIHCRSVGRNLCLETMAEELSPMKMVLGFFILTTPRINAIAP